MVTLVVVVIIIGLIVTLGRGRKGRHPRPSDSSQIRGIQQGLELWSQANQGRYPLPSLLDKADTTVALKPGEDPTTKDTTAAIVSILIYENYFGPEICISPAESNGNVTQDNDYQYSEPKAAADPKLALWDPAFSADFTSAQGGNLSYALASTSGPRLAHWKSDFSTAPPVIGNRGPRIGAVAKAASPRVQPDFNPASNTLLIHGARTTWEGNIAYSDCHVEYHSTLWGSGTYADAAGTTWDDVFFVDETDDASGLNNYLGIFTRAASGPPATQPIWD